MSTEKKTRYALSVSVENGIDQYGSAHHWDVTYDQEIGYLTCVGFNSDGDMTSTLTYAPGKWNSFELIEVPERAARRQADA